MISTYSISGAVYNYHYQCIPLVGAVYNYHCQWTPLVGAVYDYHCQWTMLVGAVYSYHCQWILLGNVSEKSICNENRCVRNVFPGCSVPFQS